MSCAKFEEILTPIVFQRIVLSKTRKDRMLFWNFTNTPKLAVHIKELVWYELAEDDSVFTENSNDRMPRYPHDKLRNAIQHDNAQTLPDLAQMASTLFWLPSAPKHDDPRRDIIERERERILSQWLPHFYRALEAMPKLDTFTSRPMPAYHVMSWQCYDYQFVAYMFQMDTRCDIQHYQRNDGLFSVLFPAMKQPELTIKHLNWADEAYGTSSSLMRLRYRNKLSFKPLESINLCLCLPINPVVHRPWSNSAEYVTCWDILGECLHRVRGLTDISLCFEKADPKVGVYTLIEALDEALFDRHIRLPALTNLTLRDGPGKRFHLLDILLGKFLVRYGAQLRHLSFCRWFFSNNLILRLYSSKMLKLEGIKIDNDDFENGANIRESDLLAFLNNDSHTWPLPFEHIGIRSTKGANDEIMETPDFRNWANPKFANIPEGMDFCAALMEDTAPSGGEDDEDEDFEPSDSTDTSDSDSDYEDLDSESDEDGDLEPQAQSSGNNGSSEEAGTV